MLSRSQTSAKAWQIHDVLQTLSSALPVDRLDDAIPIHGVVGLLIDISRQVADAVSDSIEWATQPGVESLPDCRVLRDSIDDMSDELMSLANGISAIHARLEEAFAIIDSDSGVTSARMELALREVQVHMQELVNAKVRLNELKTHLTRTLRKPDGNVLRAYSDEYSSRSEK